MVTDDTVMEGTMGDTGRLTGFISTPEAAERLGVSEKTVRNWIEAGRIKATRVTPGLDKSPWQIPSGEVERILEERQRLLNGN